MSSEGTQEDRLISEFFVGLGAQRGDVALDVGDDAALLRVPPGQELALTTDSLVLGTHFMPDSPPRSLGHRALAVNLSDLAAMGAEPSWALLSLTLPAVQREWLGEFAAGFGELARRHGVALVGGNLARGPLQICVQLAGVVDAGSAMRRSGARAGDLLIVSGHCGDSAAAWAWRQNRLALSAELAHPLCQRADYPPARIALGSALRSVASACMDVSDGLALDLPRLLAASGCGAEVDLDAVPYSAAMQAAVGAEAWRWAWSGGEDYELCCTLPPAQRSELDALSERFGLPLAVIGRCTSGGGLRLKLRGNVTEFSGSGFRHFT